MATQRHDRPTGGEIQRAAHRAPALGARLRELREIRDHFDTIKAQHDANVSELHSLEDLIADGEARLFEEARALAGVAHGHGCGCGHSSTDAAPRLAEDDEEAYAPEDSDDADRASAPGVPSRRATAPSWRRPAATSQPPGLVSMVFAVLGIGCTLASLMARRSAEEQQARSREAPDA